MMRTATSLRLWTGAQVMMFAVFGIALLVGSYRVETTANETHGALCAFKHDLERRAAATEDFIASRPNGVPGISRADFERTLANLRRTLRSLRDLDCGDS